MYGNDQWGENPYDDDDLGAADVQAAMFGPESLTPSNQQREVVPTGNPFAEEMNGIYKGFPFGNPPPVLDQKQRALVNAVALQLARMLRNTNITTADPAHISPTVWSDPIDLTTRVTLQAAADAPGVWHDGITFTTPPGRWTRWTAYGFDVIDPAFTYDGSIQWRFVVQNRPPPSLELIAQHRGSLLQPREIFLLAWQDWVTKFQYRRAVAAAGTTDIDLSIQGYTWRLRNDLDGTRASVTAY